MSRLAAACCRIATLAVVFAAAASSLAAQETAAVLTLDDAIRRALEQSQSVARSRLDIEVARAGVQGAEAARRPLVTGSAGVAWLGDPPEGIVIPTGEFGTLADPTSTFPAPVPADPVVLVPDAENLGLSASLELEQPLFTWGKLDASLEAARAEVDAQIARRDQSEREVRRRVTLAYAGAVAARESEELVREIVGLLERRVEDARRRFDAGAITRSDVLAEEAGLATARAQLVQTQQGALSAAASLAWLVGGTRDDIAATELDAPPVPEQLPDEPSLAARAGSSDPRIAELRARGAQAGVQLRVAEASRSWRPDLGLRITAEVQGQRIPLVQANWIDSWDADLTISIGASATFFDSGRNTADRRSAEAQYGQALSAIAEYQETIPLQIRSAVEAFLVGIARLEQADARRANALEQQRIATVSYENELTTRAELLGAEAAVLEARLTAIAARLDIQRAVAELEYLVGPLSR